MGTKRIVGIALLVIGLGLLFFGFQATETFTEQVHETFTGRFTDETTWYLIGGAAAAIVGLVLLLFGGKR